MTELNKQSPELQPVTVPAFVVNEYNQLKLENIALKEQLRWRPVSEPPEKAGVYFVEGKPYTGCESTIITTAYFDGESFLWYVVVRWLPIPPAPDTVSDGREAL